MKIKYKDADGKIIELEVSEEVGTFYLESIEAEKKNDRKNARPDRHALLSTFEYESADFFSDDSDLLADLIDSEIVSQILASLNERQQYLVRKCLLEGWSYSELALLEDRDESAIRHAVERARKKLRKILG